MHRIVLVLVFFACTGHARRVQTTLNNFRGNMIEAFESEAELTDSGALELAKSLLALSEAAAAFNPAFPVLGVTRPSSRADSTIRMEMWTPSRRNLLAGAAMSSLGCSLRPMSASAAEGKVNYEAVSKAIKDLVKEDPDKGPTLVRLAWHLSGTYDASTNSGGSRGGTIRFSEELVHGANAGLKKAVVWLQPIKKEFKQISYGDLITLAGVSAIEAMNGPKIGWSAGREDSEDPSMVVEEGRLPYADKGNSKATAAGIRKVFNRMGFNDQEIVALSGAHQLGRCHPNLSGYDGPWSPTPTIFSNGYFNLLLKTTWTMRDWMGPLQYEDPTKTLMMLPSDIALKEDESFLEYVKLYAGDANLFYKDFAAAFQKLEELGTVDLTPVKRA